MVTIAPRLAQRAPQGPPRAPATQPAVLCGGGGEH